MKLTELIKERPIIMGVLNCTPDSFSDGGLYLDHALALARAEELLADGAHSIDLGGSASGPGSKVISEEEELARICEIAKVLAKKTLLSIDTYHASVAAKTLALGARVINDISALRFDGEKMCEEIVQHGAYVILMHSKEAGDSPQVSAVDRIYTNIIDEVSIFLEERIAFALSQGIRKEQIIIDPGMGRYLSNNAQDSWDLLAGLEKLKARFCEFPLLVGISRKSFLGGAVSERGKLSAETSLAAFKKGADILRVHDVKTLRGMLAARRII